MFARKFLIFIGITFVLMSACSQHPPTPRPTAPTLPTLTPTPTASPTATPLVQPTLDPRRDLLKNAEEENLKRWTPEDIRRAEEQLGKIEERIRQNPDPNQTAFMQLMAQRLRQSIARAKELQRPQPNQNPPK